MPDNNKAAATLAFHGRITVQNSGEMRAALRNGLSGNPPELALDLSDVSYMDTSGVATLVEAARIARRQRTRLSLRGLCDQPRYLFEMARFDRLFDAPSAEAGT